jgi:hypothetical protein
MAGSDPELIFVFIPEPLGPMDRGDKYEDPIIDELERLGLGEVTGGGTAMRDEGPDGRRAIESCGIDVETDKLEETRAALRNLLPTLGCPPGTQLQFTLSDRELQDEYDGAGWKMEQERSEPTANLYLGRSG